MVRKLAAMFLLSLLIVAFVATTVAFGADKQVKPLKYRASVPARFAPTYSFPGLDGSEYTAPAGQPERNLRGSKSGEGIIETIGTTTYGYQHNCTMARQVEHRAMMTGTAYSTYVHFDWMYQNHDTLGQGRGVHYQAYEIAACDHVFTAGGIPIEGNYSGYVSLDANNIDAMNSWGVPAAHENDDGVYSAKTYWDFKAGGPVFGVFTSDFPIDRYGWVQNLGVGPGNEMIWPVHDWDIDGDDEVVHLVTCESGGAAGDPQNFSYYRRLGPYGTGLGVWSNQRLIDTSMNINVTVASSPISDKVAIVWNAPVDYLRDGANEFDNQYENDVWFAIATDNGAAWAATTPGPSIGNDVDLGNGMGYNPAVGGNLTTYDPMDDFKAYSEISALWYITDDAEPVDWLNFVWGGRRWTDTTSLYRRQGIIYHWNQMTDGIRTVVRADWDTGGACIAHAWGTDAAKPTISQCDGKLYVCYTQFGDRDHPCHYYDADNTVVAGLLFITVFDPIYDAWDRPQQVTAVINTTPCIPGDMSGPGDCNSEYWASMARYGRVDTCKVAKGAGDVLDILYINDYAPGGCVQTESGVWTVNPVNWAVYPCREAVPEPLYSDDAGPGYGLCVGEPILVLKTTATVGLTLVIENTGTQVMNVGPIGTTITGGGSAKTTVTTDTPGGGVVAAAGGTLVVTITITTTGEDNNVTVTADVSVTHNATNVANPRIIPMCITVSDDYFDLESAVISTFCKSLKVFNNGQLSNDAANESMDFNDDPDDCSNIYLYDGSPVVCIDRDHCYFALFDNDYASDHALRQVSPMFYDGVSNASYEYATAELVTGDSAVGMIVEYFAPKHEDSCSFIIQKIKIWNRTEIILTDVALGEALDWDIPNYDSAHAASDNESEWDAVNSLIYQYTCWNDECDTLVAANRAGGIASYKGTPFKNYMTLENDVYVYTSGPYGTDAPMPDSAIYDLMTGTDGPLAASLDSCEDLMTLVTFDTVSMNPGDTLCYIKILTTSKDDPDASTLKLNVIKANAFIDDHAEIQCAIEPDICDCVPGDGNGDGLVNVGDAVYNIAYVFQGGPPPTPYAICSGDANCDGQVNVGDAVYTIAYVFQGGPAPCSCEEWVVLNGPVQ